MTKCGSVLGLSGPAHYRPALLYIGLLYRMGLLLYRIGLLLYMGLARVIRAGWAPRNHCWVTGCLTTSLKCGADHYSVCPTVRNRNSSTSTS